MKKILTSILVFILLVGWGFGDTTQNVLSDDFTQIAKKREGGGNEDTENNEENNGEENNGEEGGNKESKENNKSNCLELNTKIPYIGRYICGKEDKAKIFPSIMTSLTKILMTLAFVVAVIAVVAGGVMMASAGGSQSRFNKGKELVFRVLISMALLGLTGVLLYMVNPNFFG